MKKLLFLAAFFLAIGSYGGQIHLAHAQTAASTNVTTATLEQQLQVAKATLVNLEQSAGMIPVGDNGTTATPTVTMTPSAAQIAAGGQSTASAQPTTSMNTGIGSLTASQVSAFEGTLSTLAATLGQLNASLASNTTLSVAQQQAVQSTLNGMANTLAAMGNTIAADMNGTNVANQSIAAAAPAPVAPSAPTAVASTPSAAATPVAVATTTPAMPTAPAVTAQATPSTQVPQTAQASSFWSFTKSHWPTIAIIVLIIAILAILFWPEKEIVNTISTQSKAQTPTVTTVAHTQNTTAAPAGAASPVSTVVGGSGHKTESSA